MNNKRQFLDKERNEKSKIMLEQVKLEYSKRIIDEIEQTPSILPEVLATLEMTREDFVECLSNPTEGNIVLYDQLLSTTLEKTNRPKAKEVSRRTR